jgi:hypothetical protein
MMMIGSVYDLNGTASRPLIANIAIRKLGPRLPNVSA